MGIEGYVDRVSDVEIAGWAYDSTFPDNPQLIEIVGDAQVVATVKANGFRQDLRDAGKGNGKHAFEFTVKRRSTTGPLYARVAGKTWYLPSAIERLPGRQAAKFMHSTDNGLPVANYGFTSRPTLSNERELMERLVESYHRTISDAPATVSNKRSDIWSHVSNERHGSVIKLVRNRDLTGLAEYLRFVHARPLTHGITQGDEATRGLRESPGMAHFVAATYVDMLSSLAEYLGIQQLECPDYGPWSENLFTDVNTLVEAINQRLSISIVPSNQPGEHFGLTTRHGILAGRDIMALYVALRIKATGRLLRIDDLEVVEIGGGAASTVYYASLLGITRYTIIDLPIVNVLQGYCMSALLGPDRVRLYGEPDGTGPYCRLLPTWMFGSPETYDILVNIDSFPEMHPSFAIDYLHQAHRKIRHLVLSINQETRINQTKRTLQSVVAELVESAGGFESLYRFRHWLRPGYVEELFRVIK